jgi:hypothetical protein
VELVEAPPPWEDVEEPPEPAGVLVVVTMAIAFVMWG